MATELIDVSVFKELQDSVGADFVVELVDTFFEEAPSMVAELRDAFSKSDAEAFRRAAHSLKTNAFTFGAIVLGEHARSLEQGGLPSDDTGLDKLDSLYAASVTALQALKNG